MKRLLLVAALTLASFGAHADQGSIVVPENSTEFKNRQPNTATNFDNAVHYFINPALRSIASNFFGASCSAIQSPVPYQWCVDTGTRQVKLFTTTSGGTSYSWQPALNINPDGSLGPTNLTLGAVSSVAGRSGSVLLTSSDLTDTTAFGRSMIEAANAAAGKTLLGLTSQTLNVTDYGAVADATTFGSGTDNLSAFQAAIAAAISQNKTLHIPGGRYRISGAGWKLDYSAPISLYGTPHSSIICDQNTVIYFDNGNYHGLEILGASDFGVGAVLPLQVSGCNFQKADAQGDAIYVDRASSIAINNNLAQGWNRGLNATDNLSSVYRENSFLFNNIGMQFQRGSFSYPNAIGLYSNRIGGNNVAGIIANNPADLLIDNADIEGNGSTGGAGHGGIIINGGPVEGGVGLNLRASHFEVNSGQADVAISATGAVGTGGATHIIGPGNDFLRIGTSSLTTNNIALSGTGPVLFNIKGNAFKGVGGYTPNAGTPYVSNTATSSSACWENNVYDSSVEFVQLDCNTAEPWATYTPTLSCATGTLTAGSATGRYTVIGKRVTVQIAATITTNGTCAGWVTASLPFAATTASYIVPGKETGLAGRSLVGQIPSSASFVNIQNYDASYPASSGAVLTMTGSYERS